MSEAAAWGPAKARSPLAIWPINTLTPAAKIRAATADTGNPDRAPNDRLHCGRRPHVCGHSKSAGTQGRPEFATRTQLAALRTCHSTAMQAETASRRLLPLSAPAKVPGLPSLDQPSEWSPCTRPRRSSAISPVTVHSTAEPLERATAAHACSAASGRRTASMAAVSYAETAMHVMLQHGKPTATAWGKCNGDCSYDMMSLGSPYKPLPASCSAQASPYKLLQKSCSAQAPLYRKRKRATSLRLMMPSTLDVSGCTTMTRRTLGMLSRSSTTRSWSCRVQTYSRVRLLAGGRACDCPPSARPATPALSKHREEKEAEVERISQPPCMHACMHMVVCHDLGTAGGNRSQCSWDIGWSHSFEHQSGNACTATLKHVDKDQFNQQPRVRGHHACPVPWW